MAGSAIAEPAAGMVAAAATGVGYLVGRKLFAGSGKCGRDPLDDDPEPE
jgi:hypothetical protein